MPGSKRERKGQSTEIVRVVNREPAVVEGEIVGEGGPRVGTVKLLPFGGKGVRAVAYRDQQTVVARDIGRALDCSATRRSAGRSTAPSRRPRLLRATSSTE